MQTEREVQFLAEENSQLRIAMEILQEQLEVEKARSAEVVLLRDEENSGLDSLEPAMLMDLSPDAQQVFVRLKKALKSFRRDVDMYQNRYWNMANKYSMGPAHAIVQVGPMLPSLRDYATLSVKRDKAVAMLAEVSKQLVMMSSEPADHRAYVDMECLRVKMQVKEAETAGLKKEIESMKKENQRLSMLANISGNDINAVALENVHLRSLWADYTTYADADMRMRLEQAEAGVEKAKKQMEDLISHHNHEKKSLLDKCKAADQCIDTIRQLKHQAPMYVRSVRPATDLRAQLNTATNELSAVRCALGQKTAECEALKGGLAFGDLPDDF
jgi:hypothetical protein